MALVIDPRMATRLRALRIAGRGQPAKAPVLLMHIGKAHEKHGQPQGLWDNYLYALRASKAVGLANGGRRQGLALRRRQAPRDHALKENQIDVSLEAYKFYSQYEKAGGETAAPSPNSLNAAPKAADAAGKQADYQDSLFMATNCSEHAMSYSSFTADEDLRPQDRYMASITPRSSSGRWENVRLRFDVWGFSTAPAPVLGNPNADLETLDWASHLVNLAQAGWPNSVQVKHLRADPSPQGRPRKPSPPSKTSARTSPKFANADEQEAWYTPTASSATPSTKSPMPPSSVCRVPQQRQGGHTTACTCSAVL